MGAVCSRVGVCASGQAFSLRDCSKILPVSARYSPSARNCRKYLRTARLPARASMDSRPPNVNPSESRIRLDRWFSLSTIARIEVRPRSFSAWAQAIRAIRSPCPRPWCLGATKNERTPFAIFAAPVKSPEGSVATMMRRSGWCRSSACHASINVPSSNPGLRDSRISGYASTVAMLSSKPEATRRMFGSSSIGSKGPFCRVGIPSCRFHGALKTPDDQWMMRLWAEAVKYDARDCGVFSRDEFGGSGCVF